MKYKILIMLVLLFVSATTGCVDIDHPKQCLDKEWANTAVERYYSDGKNLTSLEYGYTGPFIVELFTINGCVMPGHENDPEIIVISDTLQEKYIHIAYWETVNDPNVIVGNTTKKEYMVELTLYLHEDSAKRLGMGYDKIEHFRSYTE